ncbi:MAG: DUF1292 domain-containing protein [Lachnospiraceae bacterium]|nr:DUF1292 domain-containing protein [Lachnospiraceae bacterium]
MDNNKNNNELIDDDVCVTLSLEDGSEIECEILTIFDIGEQNYIVLEPAETANNPDAEEAEIFIYRYYEDEDGNYSLGNIEDDEEYEAVSDRLDELMDESYYDSLDDED